MTNPGTPATDMPGDGGPAGAAPLIVGVGASAGGLEAVSALLRGLPGDARLAIVVVQHLDALHESNLPSLLARQTALQVLQAVDGAPVEEGKV